MICIILKETNETLDSLMDLTWEQIEFLLEGIGWNMNEMTKKGRARNKAKLRHDLAWSDTPIEESLANIQGMEEKIKEWEEKKANIEN